MPETCSTCHMRRTGQWVAHCSCRSEPRQSTAQLPPSPTPSTHRPPACAKVGGDGRAHLEQHVEPRCLYCCATSVTTQQRRRIVASQRLQLDHLECHLGRQAGAAALPAACGDQHLHARHASHEQRQKLRQRRNTCAAATPVVLRAREQLPLNIAHHQPGAGQLRRMPIQPGGQHVDCMRPAACACRHRDTQRSTHCVRRGFHVTHAGHEHAENHRPLATRRSAACHLRSKRSLANARWPMHHDARASAARGGPTPPCLQVLLHVRQRRRAAWQCRTASLPVLHAPRCSCGQLQYRRDRQAHQSRRVARAQRRLPTCGAACSTQVHGLTAHELARRCAEQRVSERAQPRKLLQQ
eukprot:357001-Chlamydomonas_euryale.AAC.2